MARKTGVGRPRRMGRAAAAKKRKGPAGLRDLLWRVERLERQVSKLSQLVRQHAMDADRLVQIVAEDREVLVEELLKQRAILQESVVPRPGPGPGPGMDQGYSATS